MAPFVIQFIPEITRIWVELCSGLASTTLQKEPTTIEILNEKNAEITNLLSVIRNTDSRKLLLNQLRLTPYSRQEYMDCHEWCIGQPVEQARRTLVLLTMSFNPGKVLARQSNGFRSNTGGYYNMVADWKDVIDNLDDVANRFLGVVIESNEDIVQLFHQHDGLLTTTYFDPPYLPMEGSDTRPLYGIGCNEIEAEWHYDKFQELQKAKGFVIVKHYPHPDYLEWYSEKNGLVMKAKETYAGVSSKGAVPRTECVFVNNNIIQQLDNEKLNMF